MIGDRKRELAQIHMAKASLGWDDDHYRSILLSKTGKSSSGDLDAAGRQAFLKHLQLCGWRPTAKPFGQPEKIKWLWGKLASAGALSDPSEQALMVFVGRVTGMSVAHLKFLPVQEAIKVTEALKAWLNRASK